MEFKENTSSASTVVIVGMWNYGIFTQEWVKENVLNEEADFNVLYPTVPLLSMRFIVPGRYSFGLNGNRLEFQLLSTKPEVSASMLQAIRNILGRLVYTPINSCGINFLFSCNEVGDQIATIGNTERINTILGKNLSSIELTRSYDLSEKIRLNFKIYQENNQSNFDFNYSYKIKNCEDLLNVLEDDDCITKYRSKSLSLLNSLYNEVEQ